MSINSSMKTNYSVSFVIPLYKSERSIIPLIRAVSECNLQEWQAVLINDSSPDNVEDSVYKLIKEFPNNITYKRLSKNGGQHRAILTGLAYTRHPIIATIDDDGQNAPKDLIPLINKLEKEDLDLVYGAFRTQQQKTWRKLASKINKKISQFTIGNKNKIPLSNVRMLTSDLGEVLANSSDKYPFIDGLVFKQTDRISYEYINQYKRTEGISSYSLYKLVKLWWDHMIGYSNFILRVLSAISFVISALAFFVGVFYFVHTISDENRPAGWLSTYLTTTLLFSFLFLFLGIIGEYVGRIYTTNIQVGSKLISKSYDKKN
ncbi:glycosyltransferase [Candidatus Dojkabacteria bacterium]|nr:glycosyltransferase [Candidatus Dojkabacteria bacterium]